MYFDNNATTAPDPEVVSTILEELLKGPSNPSSVHSFGQSAKGRLAQARRDVASYFGVQPQEIIFTSGGTEALNHALFSLGRGKRILSSDLEHAAVFETLKKERVELIKGVVTLEKVAASIDNCDLLVFMAANNETGMLNPINEIADLAARKGVPLIVDGVALVGKERVTLHPGITAFACSAHKFHGPKGVGALITRQNLAPLLLGGPQEQGKRAGTENLPAIIGMAKALTLIGDFDKIRRLRDYFEELLLADTIAINGEKNRVSNTSNIYFEGVDGELLMFNLDQSGICCSHGSACSSGSLQVSRVLLALGLGMKRAKSSLRFSFSRFNTKEEVEKGVEIIKETVKKLRK
jgi:cysteine desulfurase